MSAAQPLKDQLVHAAECAGGHHHHHVPLLRLAGDGGGDLVEALDLPRVVVELLEDVRNGHHVLQPVALDVALAVEGRADDDLVRAAEGVDVAGLELLAHRGDRARLEQRPDAPAGVALARAVERGGDGRGMVGEVVDDGDAALDAAHFHAPLDPLKRLESLLDLLRAPAAHVRHGDAGQRVGHVVLSRERRAEGRPLAPLPGRGERGRVLGQLDVFGRDVASLAEAERQPTGAGGGAQRGHALVVAVGHDHAVRRHALHALAEGVDDRVHVGVDVSVVELDVVDDQRVRAVVEKLGPLVEERGVVLVAFDDELRVVAELEVLIEIEGDAADDHARVASRRLEQPGQERGRRRLAVRPGDDDGVPAFDEQLVDGLGHRGVRQVELERGSGLGIGFRRRVADDHQIGPERQQVLLRIPLEHRNPQPFEVRGHGGIDVLVGPADLVAPLLEHAGQRGHGGTGDPDQVDALDARSFFDVGHRSNFSKKRAVAGIPRPVRGVRTIASEIILIQNQSSNTGGSFMSSKRILVVMMALFVALTASLALAQDTKKAEAASAKDADKAPRLTIVEPVKDYGTVPQGAKLSWTFAIKNTGTSDLQIIAARPACGCTVADFDKVIKAGESGKVAATVDTTAFSGPIAKTITLETNDPTTPTSTLTLHAIVKPYVAAYQAGFVRYTLLQGDAESQSIK